MDHRSKYLNNDFEFNCEFIDIAQQKYGSFKRNQ